MKLAVFLSFLLSMQAFAQSQSDLALKKLMEGNERFIVGKPMHPNQNELHRENVSSKQEPFAVIVCCSDSRVAPEIIFDRGLGDTFVVRVAGNVVGSLGMESVCFAVDILSSPLIMVLGHENCGAVKAVLAGGDNDRDIPAIAKKIEPAIAEAKKMKGDALVHAIELNAKAVKADLEKNQVLSSFIQQGKLKIVSAYYDFSSGKVSLLD